MKCLYPDAIAGSVDRENELQNSVGAESARGKEENQKVTLFTHVIFFR